MYCARCGNKNPEGAAFCAFCGTKLVVPEAEVIEAELVDEVLTQAEAQSAPAAPASASRSHEAFMRPDPQKLVTPLVDNPAQPGRRAERQAEEARPAPAKAPPTQAPRRRAAAPAGGARPADAASRAVPERKAPVAPKRRDDWAAPSTIVPRRKRRKADDLFFDDIEQPEEMPYDEEESFFARHIKSAVAGLFLLVALGVVFWLLVLPGGQTFCAQMGLDAPASAYARLGESYLNEGSVKRAADAFYTALRRAPDSYDYALRVGQTQELLGDQQRAMSAYAMCISISPTRTEPYEAVAKLYEQMGDRERAANALKTGYDKTGSLDLFRAYEEMTSPAA